MAYSLNTSHPLYPSLVALFIADGNFVRDLVTPSRTITPNAAVTYGSGTYGTHFSVAGLNQYSARGVAFDRIPLDTTANDYSFFCAFNDIGQASYYQRLFGDPAASSNYHPNIFITNGGVAGMASGYSGAASLVGMTNVAAGAVAHVLTMTRPKGESNPAKLIVNGNEEASGPLLYADATTGISYIGGYDGQSSCTASVFAIAIFSKLLTAAEEAGLRTSLSGGNAFALIQSQGDSTPPVISGAIQESNVSSTAYTIGGWSATDNVGVLGFERSLDGGTTWVDIGSATTSNVTGRTPGALDQVRIRAYDLAGNRSSVLSKSVQLLAGGARLVVSVVNRTRTAQASISIPRVLVQKFGAPEVNVLSLAAQQTDANGDLVIDNSALTRSAEYLVIGFNSDASKAFAVKSVAI